MNKRGSLVNFSTKYVKIYLSSAPQDHSVDCPVMDALLDRAREVDIDVVVAGVSNTNSGGIKFHKKMGFHEVGRMPGVGRKNGRRFDLVLLQIDLGTDIPVKGG